MNIEASMVNYYAERAREYERIYQKPERQDDLRRLRELVRAELAETHMFEVACGTGYWTEVAAHSAASILATDINEEVLAIARAKNLDSHKVTFRKEDSYKLPVMPQKFTTGMAMFWWSHIPKARLRNFLTGFHRVLAPGARVLFVDNNYVAGSSTPISRTDENGNTYQTRRLDDGSTHEVLKNFPTESELRAAIEGLGDAARVENLHYYWMLTYNTSLIPGGRDSVEP